MRVGVIGPTGNDTFADNILNALEELGHEGVSLGRAVPQYRSPYVNKIRALIQSQTANTELLGQRDLVRRVKGADIDIVITVENRLMPQTVTEISRGGRIPISLWYPDHLSNIGRLGMASDGYTAVFLKDLLFAERMRNVYGVNAHYLPEGCTPAWHSSSEPWGADPWIAVVGNIYPTRARLLRRLSADGVPIRVFGAAPPQWLDDPVSDLHAGKSVYRREKADVFRRARAVLNNLHPAEMESLNCRLFEATCAGGVVLCEERAELANLFDPGREVLPFASYDDLLMSCRLVLTDSFGGQHVGDAASARAQRDHTIRSRVAKIVETTS